MLRSLYQLIGVISMAFLAAGCNQAIDLKDPSVDRAFYPTAMGQYHIYDVVDIKFNNGIGDTNTYQLQTVITDSIVNESVMTYLLTRSKRLNESLEWEIDSVWSVWYDDQKLVVVENNVALVKLVFPVEAGITWNGHAYNGRGEAIYSYRESTFDDDLVGTAAAIQVVIADIPKNLVNQNQKTEIYAKGIGLVSKDYVTLKFCQSGCPIGSPESGHIKSQVLREYGKR